MSIDGIKPVMVVADRTILTEKVGTIELETAGTDSSNSDVTRDRPMERNALRLNPVWKLSIHSWVDASP